MKVDVSTTIELTKMEVKQFLDKFVTEELRYSTDVPYSRRNVIEWEGLADGGMLIHLGVEPEEDDVVVDEPRTRVLIEPKTTPLEETKATVLERTEAPF